MTELLRYSFMQNALAAALLASVICGILGPITVIRRSVMTTGGVAHGAYGGLGLAWFMGWPPRAGVYGAALVLAGVATWLRRKTPHRADTVMGILWAVGMATGIVFTDLTPGYGTELTSYLFGSILTVSAGDLSIMGALAVASLVLIALWHDPVEAFLFDETYASTRGVPVAIIDGVLTLLTSLAVVAVIRVIGLILVIALFTVPSAITEGNARSLTSMMVRSTIVAALFCLVGLWISVQFNITAGAAIILTAAVAYGGIVVIRSIR
ncbi:MAG: hypothetical protein CSA35_02110 [Dethiosulfovibrio peptidovorans]|nr:MAG: hypothetical protein CSA35_02110 [Dethiosulfovibrio peptidovorans]